MGRNILKENVAITLTAGDDIQTALDSLPSMIDGVEATVNLAGNPTTPVTYSLGSGLIVQNHVFNEGALNLAAATGAQSPVLSATAGSTNWVEFAPATPADYEGLWVDAEIRIVSVGLNASNSGLATDVGQKGIITAVTQPVAGTIRVGISTTWNVNLATAGDITQVKVVLNSCIIDNAAGDVLTVNKGIFMPKNICLKGHVTVGINWSADLASFSPQICMLADSTSDGISIRGYKSVVNTDHACHIINATGHGVGMNQASSIIFVSLNDGYNSYISGCGLNGITSDSSNMSGNILIRKATFDRNGDWGVFVSQASKGVVRNSDFFGVPASNQVRIISADNSAVFTDANGGDHVSGTDEIASNGGVFI